MGLEKGIYRRDGQLENQNKTHQDPSQGKTEQVF